ncbi:hypothetical protein EV401DRAFT_1886113 [Pisolithus croceorrhizus]|nr:hypothetical protein EV401DRAFT_1886113 [Pisolithus croceorrhizus]
MGQEHAIQVLGQMDGCEVEQRGAGGTEEDLRIYQDLEGFHTKSGCHWDNTCGAGVQGKFDEEVFENYAKCHLLIQPFKNSGWEYYDLMVDIMPNGAAHGTNAFTLSTSHVTMVDPNTKHPPAMLDGGELEVGLPTFNLAATDGSSHSIDVTEWHQTLQGSAFPTPSFISGVTTPDTPQSSRLSAPPSSAPPSTVHGMKSGEMPPPPSSSLGK